MYDYPLFVQYAVILYLCNTLLILWIMLEHFFLWETCKVGVECLPLTFMLYLNNYDMMIAMIVMMASATDVTTTTTTTTTAAAAAAAATTTTYLLLLLLLLLLLQSFV